MRYRFVSLISCVVLIFSLCGLGQAEAYKSQPIPAGLNAHTQKDFDKTLDKYNYRTIVEAYKTLGKQDANHDAAVTFLEDYIKWMNRNGDFQVESFLNEGKKLVEAGCSDPIVVSCVGIALFQHGYVKEAVPVLEKSLEGFQKYSAYPKCRARLVPTYLLRCHQQLNDAKPEDIKHLQDMVIQLTVQSLTDGSFVKGESRIMLSVIYWGSPDLMNDGLWDLYTAAKNTPGADPYFVKTMGGLLEINKAWAARGAGWAYEVNDEGWEKFAEHLGIARRLLTEAWKLHPEFPDAPTAMIQVAMGGHAGPGETPRTWFDRAVAAQLDYSAAYDKLEYALLPRWDGSIEELYAFGTECLKTRRFDTCVPWQFYNLLRVIESENDYSLKYWTMPQTRKRLDIMFAGYEKSQYAREAKWYKSLEAGIAWYCGKNNDAKRILNELGDKVTLGPFPTSCGTNLEQLKFALANNIVNGSPVRNTDNGHYYKVYRRSELINWHDANELAESYKYKNLKGHLLTITSDMENEFVGNLPNGSESYWMGGYQPADNLKAGSGWKWVTDEPWSYSKIKEWGDVTTQGALVRGINNKDWYYSQKYCRIPGFIVEFE